MSHYKNNNNISPGANQKTSAGHLKVRDSGKSGYESTLREGGVRGGSPLRAAELGRWDSYRRWLNHVQAPDKRRTPVDPALYTWKGYRSWSEKVRRNWKSEE